MSEQPETDSTEAGKGTPPKPEMPLALASIGQEVVLASVRGGRRLVHRLAEMGLRPGARFRIFSKGSPGPLIIRMRGSRLVIGQGMAHRMYVRPT